MVLDVIFHVIVWPAPTVKLICNVPPIVLDAWHRWFH